MIIINAVECSNSSTLQNIVDGYLKDNYDYKVYTDDLDIKRYVDSKYEGKCVYNKSLVALWLQIAPEAILIITDITNTCSEVYSDLTNNYTITCIEESENYINTSNRVNCTGGY